MPANFMFVTVTFIGAPLLAILVNNLFPRDAAKKFCLPLDMAVASLQIIAALVCMALLWQNGRAFIDFSMFWDMNLLPGSARFTVDILSLTVLLAIGMVVLVSLLTARQTLDTNKELLNFCNLLMVIMIGMNGLVMSGDLFSLYVFLEVTAVSSFVLIALKREQRGLEGAFKYLAMSAIASAFLLASLAFIFMETGSLAFADVAASLTDWKQASQPVLLMLAFVFFCSACAIKSGLAPFHGWLPDAYQSAPAAVSVLLSGIVTKAAGAYAIIRVLSKVFAGVNSLHTIFAVLGVLSIIFGALAAIGQRDLKRLLAYSSISQIGYIVLGAASGSLLGAAGAMLHFFNHATFKTTLFVNAAVLEKQVGSTDLESIGGGLQARMPLTGTSSILAFLSAAGIPPLAGFWSKLLIIIAVWQAGYITLASLALFASILTAVYFLRVQRQIFFGPLDEKCAEVEEIRGPMALAELLLSVVTVGCGLLFPLLLLFFQGQGLI